MKLVACSLLVACGAGELPPSVEPVVQPAPKPRPAKARQLDVNGDGFADVVASQATRLDPIQVPTAGSVLIYLGGKHGLRDVPDFELVGPNGDPLFGPIEVEGIGDVNGDGRSDLLVQETEINGNTFGGSAVAYIYFGGRVGPSTTPDQQLMTPNGDRDHVRFATVGDVDGDGYSDLAARVDCPSLAWPEDKRDPRRCTRDLDALYIYRGSAGGLGVTPATRSERKFDMRWSMLGLGDFDGDGFDDVLWHDEVFLGSRTGIATTPALTLTAPRGRLRISRAVRGGDLDHDGFPELVVIGTDDGDREGVASQFVFRGAATPEAKPARTRLRPWFDNESVGDVTGDGIDDLMIRSTNVEVFAGRSAGLPDINPVATLDTPSYPGNAVSPGDIDGDGIRDLIVATRTSSVYRTRYPGYTTVIAFRGAPQNMFAKPFATLTGRRNGGDFPQFIAGPGIR